MSIKNNKYIVRQPIKDTNNQIIGYEILYHGENQAFDDSSANDFAAADTVYNFLLQNSGKVLRGTKNFMTFTTTLLVKKTPRMFDQSELVIQIDDSVIIHPLAMHLVRQYSKDGYKIAVNEFQFAPRYLALMDDIDYIKLDIQTMPENTMHNIIEIAHSMHKQCIAMNIRTEDHYKMAMSLGFDGLQGNYVADKIATQTHSSGYLQSNFFRLMVAVTQEEPNVDEIEELISLDATLTYGILKMVNSCYFALRQPATTVQQAIMTIGLNQLKQWVYLLSASNAENEFDSGAEELLKLSLMRANFCSALMDYAKNIPINRSEAYLMGMFSTLNYLINVPMEEILGDIPIRPEIKDALVKYEGRAGMLYRLSLSYEKADWPQINELSEALEIPTNLLTTMYFNCMEEVNDTWSQLTNPNPDLMNRDEEQKV